MNCLNKNKILDFYFSEGTESELNNIREHINKCSSCQLYLSEIKQTMCKLEKLEDQAPPENVLNRIIAEVSVSVPKPAVKERTTPVTSILQIALGQIFLFALIYIVNSSAVITKIWDSVKNFQLFQVLGSMGLTVIIVFGLGAFVTLAVAPVLLFESKNKKSFSLK